MRNPSGFPHTTAAGTRGPNAGNTPTRFLHRESPALLHPGLTRAPAGRILLFAAENLRPHRPPAHPSTQSRSGPTVNGRERPCASMLLFAPSGKSGRSTPRLLSEDFPARFSGTIDRSNAPVRL